MEDLVIFESIDGAKVINALSKPQGSFKKEKKRIIRRFREPSILDRDRSDIILTARFITSGLTHEFERVGVLLNLFFMNRVVKMLRVVVVCHKENQEFDVENPFCG